jgi:hypothetical protein
VAASSQHKPENEALALLDAMKCVGRKARLVMQPKRRGQIVAVIVTGAGRRYVFAYVVGAEIMQVVVEGCQLELIV